MKTGKTRREIEKIKKDMAKIALADDTFVEDYVKDLMKDDGRAHIEVDLRHGNEIFEPYSSHKDISHHVIDYIENVAKYLTISTPITIDFVMNEDNREEEQLILNEYRAEYHFESSEKHNELKKNRFEVGWLMIVGVVFLVVYFLLGYFGQSNAFMSIIAEVVSIASWVFIWDAVDKFFFERQSIRKSSFRAIQLASAKVVFIIKNEN